MSVSEIPLTANNQYFTISLSGSTVRMRLIYRDAAGWILDIQDSEGTDLVSGVPLIPGVNLSEHYPHLDFDGMLVVGREADGTVSPAASGPGLSGTLYFIQKEYYESELVTSF